jgi:hypothetical protein
MRTRIFFYHLKCMCSQEVVQSVGTTPNEADVISSDLPFPSYADMSKKEKKIISNACAVTFKTTYKLKFNNNYFKFNSNFKN